MPNFEILQCTYYFYRLYVNYRLRYGVEKQFKAFMKGFSELVPLHLIKMFDERELEVCILNC